MQRRKGFTLVELMVSLALTIFMMAILSEAFVVGLESFRKLRQMAELEQGMRTVEAILRRDLAANHFEGDKRLSELTACGQRIPTFPPFQYDQFNNSNAPSPTRVTDDPMPGPGYVSLFPYRLVPPALGFFNISEGFWLDSANRPWPQCPDYTLAANSNKGFPQTVPNGVCQYEGFDVLGKPSWRDTNDSLHFTVRLNGNKRESFFTGKVFPLSYMDPARGWPFVGNADSRFGTAGNLSSQWAEVIYFLAPVASGDNQPPGKPLLYNLYRRQLLLLPDAMTIGSNIASEAQLIARGQAQQYQPPPATPLAGNPIQNPVDYFGNYDLSAFWYQQSAVYANGDNNYYFNNAADVQFVPRRYSSLQVLGPTAGSSIVYPRFQDIPNYPPSDPRVGSELLLANVLSFDVKILDPIPTTSADIYQPMNGYGQANTPTGSVTFPNNSGLNGQPGLANPNRFVDVGFGRNFTNKGYGPFVGAGNNSSMPYSFDTWSTRNNGLWNYGDQANFPIPYNYPFTAIQVKVRVWDRKTNQTRELTIIQDM